LLALPLARSFFVVVVGSGTAGPAGWEVGRGVGSRRRARTREVGVGGISEADGQSEGRARREGGECCEREGPVRG